MTRHGWYYESCPTCKKSNKFPGATLECNCGQQETTKYRIEIDVEYGGHEVSFVFWDKDVVPFVQLSATELRHIMKESDEDHPNIYPTHLDKLLNSELAY